MANVFKLKRSAVTGNIPTTAQLDLGEIAINTFDGKMFIKRDNGTPTVIQIGDVVGPASATDNALARFDATTGKLIQNSTATLSDTGTLDTPNLTTDYIQIDTAATPPTIAPGILAWNDGEGTLDLGLKGGNVTLQLGQEQHARVYNDSGSTLNEGEVVYISGSQGNRIAVKRALASSEATSAYTLGMVTEPILNGAEGYITTNGLVNKLNTSTLTAGAVYLSASVAGAYTQTKPTAPNHIVVVGFVNRISTTVGSIYIKVDNGYEIDELHDVLVSSYANGQLLIRDQTAGVWKNATLTAGTGISITNAAGAVTITNTAGGGGGGSSVTIGTAAPTSPSAGALWWNSEEGKLKIYYTDADTSQWVDTYIGVKGDQGDQGPQGIQGTAGPTGPAGPGVPTGGTAGQALVKTSTTDYDDAWTTLTLSNLPDAWVKKACRVATTANITLSGTQTIDGIAVVAGDRVLVKNQTTASQNGIYDVAAGSWTRSLDANTASYIAGALVSIDLGTVNGGKVYDTDFKSTDTIGTTAIIWNRMLDDSSLALYYRKNTSTTLTSGTSAQSWLGLTNGVTVAANTIYAFEGFFELTTSGTTSHTEGLLFGLSSATVTNITWHVTRYTNTTTATAPISNTFTSASTSVVTNAITTAQDVHYRIRGTVAIGTGGNFNPQIIFSAAPGGTSTVSLGAYFEMTPIGTTGGNVSNGTWS